MQTLTDSSISGNSSSFVPRVVFTEHQNNHLSLVGLEAPKPRSTEAIPAASKIEKSSAFRKEQRSVVSDLVISACFGLATAAIASMTHLLSLPSAFWFSFGSLLSYALAIYRVQTWQHTKSIGSN